MLIARRILSGLPAGLMTGTATATLTELIPASASRRASLVATAANAEQAANSQTTKLMRNH